MKYLRRFNTEEEYQTFKNSSIVAPNVSLIAGSGLIVYHNNKPANGVYIQHINGGLFTVDEWSRFRYTNDSANGVAVVTDEASFVIAKTIITKTTSWASNTMMKISGVTATTSEATAKLDYNGKANTELILPYDTSGAVYQCANYEFPNGQKGYLPALGELILARNVKADIDVAMNAIGGDVYESYPWSSTQYNDIKAWDLHNDSELTRYSEKSKLRMARAFASLSF